MTLLVILCTPLIAAAVARWAWRLHRRALRLLGPGIANLAGAPARVGTAEVVSVLVETDIVLVGLRPAPTDSARRLGATVRVPESTLVLSLDGHGSDPVARLQRWQVSGASVLHWRDDADDTVEFFQLQTGQRVRLPLLSGMIDGRPARVMGHPSRRDVASG